MITKMTQFFASGGLFMIPLVLCSIISVTVILERCVALRRSRHFQDALIDAIVEYRPGGKTSFIEQVCAGSDTTLSRLVRSCLMNLPWTKFENTETLQTKARGEVSRMDRGLVLLEVIVGVGPLLGLLGTVSGLITIFGDIGGASIADQGVRIAQGIAEALNTTVAGLVVAIPSLIAHSIFARRIDTYAVEMESICVDFLGKLYGTPSPGTGS